MKTQNEMYEVIGRLLTQLEEGQTKYPGMSYEEGVDEALRWVMGNMDDGGWPFTEDES